MGAVCSCLGGTLTIRAILPDKDTPEVIMTLPMCWCDTYSAAELLQKCGGHSLRDEATGEVFTAKSKHIFKGNQSYSFIRQHNLQDLIKPGAVCQYCFGLFADTSAWKAHLSTCNRYQYDLLL